MSDILFAEKINDPIADATVLYQKLRHYHWNVYGPNFFVLQERFEVLYKAWESAIDELAECVRAMGGVPVHTLAGVLKRASLKEDDTVPEAPEMVRRVAADLERLHARISDLVEEAEYARRGTADLLGSILNHVEKDLWMLGAWLHPGDVPAPEVDDIGTESPVQAEQPRLPYMQPD